MTIGDDHAGSCFWFFVCCEELWASLVYKKVPYKYRWRKNWSFYLWCVARGAAPVRAPASVRSPVTVSSSYLIDPSLFAGSDRGSTSTLMVGSYFFFFPQSSCERLECEIKKKDASPSERKIISYDYWLKHSTFIFYSSQVTTNCTNQQTNLAQGQAQ